MNNLKFRVWDKVLKVMSEIIRIDLLKKEITYYETNNCCYKEINVDFNNYVIMQSTGLFDKNGVEIFEGDIVIDTVGPQIKMVVKWIDDCAAFRTIGTYEGENFVGYVGHETKFGKNTCQVIGNIYENKELLR